MTSLMEVCLILASKAYPYYSRGFAALTLVERPELLQLTIDRHWRLYWSDQAILGQVSAGVDKEDIARHMLEHVLRGHGSRWNSRDPFLWQISCDVEVNDDLPTLSAIGPSPSSCGLARAKTAEQYYDGTMLPSTCTCGGGSGVGSPAPNELGAPSSSNPGVCDVEAPAILGAIASDIKISAQRGEHVDAAAKLWAEAYSARQVRVSSGWKTALQKGLKEAAGGGQEDWTWMKPSRRQEGRVLFPAVSRTKRHLRVVIDTSGSMSPHAQAVADICGVLSRSADCEWVYGDTVERGRSRATKIRDVIASAVGGGGTDMRPLCKGPTVIVTDGETPWPDPWPPRTVAIVVGGPHPVVHQGPSRES